MNEFKFSFADVNAFNLFFAAVHDNSRKLSSLIAAGANIEQQNERGQTPLHGAALLGSVDALIKLKGNIEAQDENGFTPLHWAIIGGNTEAVNSLIAAGANIEAQVEDEITPLHLAALVDNTEILNALIAKGANIEAQDKDGETPLHCAASRGSAEAIDSLIAAGADIEARDENGWTSLHAAAAAGNAEVVNALIATGVNIDEDGWTPLHAAAAAGNAEVVKALIAAGADIEAQDEDGRTPLHCIQASEDTKDFNEAIQSFLLQAISNAVCGEDERIPGEEMQGDVITISRVEELPENSPRRIGDTSAITALLPFVSQLNASGWLKKSNLVKVRGDIDRLSKVSGGDGLLHGTVRAETGELKEFVKLERINPDINPVTLSAGFMALSQVVGQAHLANINRSLVNIQNGVDKVSFFQHNERKAGVIGSIRYYRQLMELDSVNQSKDASMLNQIEFHESKLLDIQTHLVIDLGEFKKNVSGKEFETEELKGHCEEFVSMCGQIMLVIAARHCGVRLRERFLGGDALTEVRKVEIENAAGEFCTLFSDVWIGINKCVDDVSVAFWGPSKEDVQKEIRDIIVGLALETRRNMSEYWGDILSDGGKKNSGDELYIELDKDKSRIENLYVV